MEGFREGQRQGKGGIEVDQGGTSGQLGINGLLVPKLVSLSTVLDTAVYAIFLLNPISIFSVGALPVLSGENE